MAEFVGGKVVGKAGATSGTSTIDLSTGLTGGSRDHVEAGDLVIAVFGVAATASATLSITDGTTNYTQVGNQLYADDTSDALMRVALKFMGETPDSATTFGPTTNNAWGGATAVYVLSGIDPSTPLDVAVVETSGTDGCRPEPGAITPVTDGALIVVAGVGGYSASGGGTDYTSPDLSGFLSGVGHDNDDAQLGIGYHAWTSGEFDPATFTDGSSNSGSSWVAMTIALRPAAGGTEEPIVRVDETDTAFGQGFAVLAAKASETDSAFSLGFSVPFGRCDETDTALGLEGSVSASPATGIETDTAFGLGLSVNLARADQTDTAFALSGATAAQFSPGLETDTALGLGFAATFGVAAESETAFAPAGLESAAVARADETDLALGLGAAFAFGRADELDTALAVAGTVSADMAAGEETDLAFGSGMAVAIGPAFEADTALGLDAVTAFAPGRADESDQALALGMASPFGRANETDTALPLATDGPAFARVDETDTALALTGVVSGQVSQASQTDTALPLAGETTAEPGIAGETDTATGVPVAIGMGRASETGSAFGLAARLIAEARLAAETDIALFLDAMLSAEPGRADETDTAFALEQYEEVPEPEPPFEDPGLPTPNSRRLVDTGPQRHLEADAKNRTLAAQFGRTLKSRFGRSLP